MADVLTRPVYSTFAAAFLAYRGRSVPLESLQPIRDVHVVQKFRDVLRVNDHQPVVMQYQTRCYGILALRQSGLL